MKEKKTDQQNKSTSSKAWVTIVVAIIAAVGSFFAGASTTQNAQNQTVNVSVNGDIKAVTPSEYQEIIDELTRKIDTLESMDTLEESLIPNQKSSTICNDITIVDEIQSNVNYLHPYRDIESENPVRLHDLVVLEQQNIYIGTAKKTDAANRIWENTIEVQDMSKEGEAYIDFFLDQKFTVFRGVYTPLASVDKSENIRGAFYIDCNGERVITSEKLINLASTITIDIDVSNITVLRIGFLETSNCLIGDIMAIPK